MSASERLSTGSVAAFAAGSFGTGVFATVPTVLLLYFCTEVLGIDPGWAAALMLAPKLWALGWDPFVGAWSDHTTGRLGRRRPFLIAGLVGVAAAFVALFSPPSFGPVGLVAWTAVGYFALTTLYSLFAVPYAAIPAEIGADGAERARLVSWRMTVVMIGVLAGAGGAPMLVEATGGGRAGYVAMSVIIACACALAMAAPIAMLRGRDVAAAPRTEARVPLLAGLAVALRPTRFRLLIGAYIALLTGSGALTAAAPYLVSGALGRPPGDIGTALVAMMGVTTLSVPLWAAAGRRWGEHPVLCMAAVMFAAAAAALGLAAITAAPWPLALALFAAAGLPFGGLQVLPYTLVAHLVHAEAGERGDEGAFTGVWMATEKIGLALGPAVLGLALATFGKDPARFAAVGPGALALLAIPFLLLAAPSRKAGSR